MSDALAQLAQRLRRPQASLSGLDCLSDEQLTELRALVDAASERERRRVQSQLRRGIFWPLRWLLQRRQTPSLPSGVVKPRRAGQDSAPEQQA